MLYYNHKGKAIELIQNKKEKQIMQKIIITGNKNNINTWNRFRSCLFLTEYCEKLDADTFRYDSENEAFGAIKDVFKDFKERLECYGFDSNDVDTDGRYYVSYDGVKIEVV